MNKFGEFILSKMGVHLQPEPCSLPPGVVAVLGNTETVDIYPASLGALVMMMCGGYAVKFKSSGTFSGPEPGSNDMKYWESWQFKLQFFLSLILQTIHSVTDDAGEISSDTSWLNQIHYARKVEEDVENWEAFDDGEYRRYLHPNKFLCLFAELFPFAHALNLVHQESYTINDLLICIQFSIQEDVSATSKKFAMFRYMQCRKFDWKQHYYNFPVEHKNIAEHTLRVMMTLMCVNHIKTDILYNNICPAGATL